MESLGFEETRDLLERYKIPLCPTKLAAYKNEAAAFAKSVGYPAVLKVFSRGVIHKTDLGLVKTDLKNEVDLKNTWDEIIKKTRGIKTEGILVQKQISGVETVIGMKRDAQFGPVIMFGLGGILVEIIKDVSFRIAPLERADAMTMMQEVRGYKLLKGFRSTKPVDIKKLASMIIALSRLSLENNEIAEIDLNPVIANEKGAWVVDPRFLKSP
ncbi:MAG: acetate--CoA ligase family protein [Candidatus Nealsonbacteria bacterium]|nr:acetate--CoA ligase family protein [Candidatus Nealsonbacteria bacterium]